MQKKKIFPFYCPLRSWLKIKQNLLYIQKITKNTGLPEYKIQRIKHHLFYDNTHILEREERIGRFSPNAEIAKAWHRLYKTTIGKAHDATVSERVGLAWIPAE